jgi:hypothetical protein
MSCDQTYKVKRKSIEMIQEDENEQFIVTSSNWMVIIAILAL